MRNVARSKISLLGIGGLLVVLVVVGLVSCNREDAPPKPTATADSEDARQPQGNSATVAVKSSGWTAVTVTDGSVFFGKRSDVGESRIIYLDDAYFIAKGSEASDANSLRRFGNEVHMPVSAVALPRTSVLYSQSLVATSPVVRAIAKFEKKQPATATVVADVIADAPYAIFLKDGQVVFGRITMEDGLVVVTDTHYLSFKDTSVAQFGEIRSLDDVTLVPQMRTVISPSGVMEVPLTSVLYYQEMSKDSPIVKAMNEQ